MVRRFFPFRDWFPLTREKLRADAIAGTTVALILIPQSMAYAQLAGMPAYYGLYAAFLPVIVGALWGSSHQLSTGPVAMVSLLTGSTLAQFASPGSEQFIAYAILLALMAGVMQLVIGAFRLGAVINFLSHPVIVGFTNAAAIIIALSQINKMLGVPIGRSEHFLLDVWTMLQQIGEVHVPSLFMGVAALLLILLLRKARPAWPGVLITVALATLVSWAIDFENNIATTSAQFEDVEVRNVIDYVTGTASRIGELNTEMESKARDLKQLERTHGEAHPRIVVLTADIEILRLDARTIEREHRLRMRELRRFVFERIPGRDGASDRFYLVGTRTHGENDGRHWRIRKAGNDGIELSGGGEVVGHVPAGLPALALPRFTWDLLVTLLPSALVITLVGFMETISVAKAMATRTRQRIDPNQELIGQGLANIAGSIAQSFPVSGSFSRSAVNLTAGAQTGFSSVITGALVLATLLLLTPLLYHLPQSVLAAVIMAAVGNLINFKAIRHAWAAQRHDGIAAIVAFVATLGFAPHLDTGILVGGALAIVLYLYRTMRPRIAVLSRHPDGTLRDARLHGLPTSPHIIVIRFDGSLYFANVPYFEDTVLQEAAQSHKAKFILIVADGINEIEGSGVEAIRHMVGRLKDAGITMLFSGVKNQVLQVMDTTGLHSLIGVQNFFRTEEAALDAIYRRIDDPSFDPSACPLSPPKGDTQPASQQASHGT
jgi:SulP family sulfate permease